VGYDRAVAVAADECFAGGDEARPHVADRQLHPAAVVDRFTQGVVPRALVAQWEAVQAEDNVAALESHLLGDAAPANARDPLAEAVDVEAAEAEAGQVVADRARVVAGIQEQGLRLAGRRGRNRHQGQSGQQGQYGFAGDRGHRWVSSDSLWVGLISVGKLFRGLSGRRTSKRNGRASSVRAATRCPP